LSETAPTGAGLTRWFVHGEIGNARASTPGLQFHQPAPGVGHTRDPQSDLAGRNGREGELPPHLVVSSHTAARHGYPTAAVPVLHVKGKQTVERERLCFRRGVLDVRIIMQTKDVDLVDRFAAGEVNLDPIGH